MHDIMTVQEVAEYLRVSERTIYDWATKGRIPCGKLGTTWRFKRAEIEKWVDKYLHKDADSPESYPHITDILTPERVLMLQTPTKKEALETIIEVIATSPAVKDKRQLAEGIFRREQLMSTGIGLGIAVPHVRLDSVEELVMAVGVGKNEIKDYESLDGKPVRAIFLIAAGRNQHTQHIKTLALISRKVKDEKFRSSLLSAPDEAAVYKLLSDHN